MLREQLRLEDQEAQGPELGEKDLFVRKKVKSHLEGPSGEREELSVAVSERDGAVRGVNFWDLDKTLLVAEPIHAKAVDKIFPEQAKDEAAQKDLHKVYFDGFKLGNSFREWDRMWKIYSEGREEYKDPATYEAFLNADDNRKKVDESGNGIHERANLILQRYGQIAYEFMKAEYDKHPKEEQPAAFQKEFGIESMMQLIEKKTRLGQVNVFMTANQRDFARGLVAFSGLNKYGLALATDETMAGGGKEIAIRKLIEELDSMGLKINKKRATSIGDSIKGDVGSGTKEGLANGILVVESEEDVRAILERAAKDTQDGRELRPILEKTRVEAVRLDEITKSRYDVYRHGKRSSQAKDDSHPL